MRGTIFKAQRIGLLYGCSLRRLSHSYYQAVLQVGHALGGERRTKAMYNVRPSVVGDGLKAYGIRVSLDNGGLRARQTACLEFDRNNVYKAV